MIYSYVTLINTPSFYSNSCRIQTSKLSDKETKKRVRWKLYCAQRLYRINWMRKLGINSIQSLSSQSSPSFLRLQTIARSLRRLCRSRKHSFHDIRERMIYGGVQVKIGQSAFNNRSPGSWRKLGGKWGRIRTWLIRRSSSSLAILHVALLPLAPGGKHLQSPRLICNCFFTISLHILG